MREWRMVQRRGRGCAGLLPTAHAADDDDDGKFGERRDVCVRHVQHERQKRD